MTLNCSPEKVGQYGNYIEKDVRQLCSGLAPVSRHRSLQLQNSLGVKAWGFLFSYFLTFFTAALKFYQQLEIDISLFDVSRSKFVLSWLLILPLDKFYRT